MTRRVTPTIDEALKARAWLFAAANKGHADAQNDLGHFYAWGDQTFDIKKDFVEARKWWEKSAESGNGRAKEELAWRYEQGADGFPRKPERAVDLRKTIAKGYRQGIYGLPKNARMADSNLSQVKRTTDLEQQIKDGNPEALATLGWQLLQVPGAAMTTKNEGLTFLERAAANGDSELQYEIGAIYMFGNYGIDKDFDRGGSWWDKASEQNHVRTLTYLAPAYQNGRFGYSVDLLKSKPPPGHGHFRPCLLQGTIRPETGLPKSKRIIRKSARSL